MDFFWVTIVLLSVEKICGKSVWRNYFGKPDNFTSQVFSKRLSHQIFGYFVYNIIICMYIKLENRKHTVNH